MAFFAAWNRARRLNNNSCFFRLKRWNPLWATMVVPLDSSWFKCNKVTENCFAGSAATQRISTLALLAWANNDEANTKWKCEKTDGLRKRMRWTQSTVDYMEWNNQMSRIGGKSNTTCYQAMLGHYLVCLIQLRFVRVSWLLILPKSYCSDLMITASQIASHTQNHYSCSMVNDTRWQ